MKDQKLREQEKPISIHFYTDHVEGDLEHAVDGSTYHSVGMLVLYCLQKQREDFFDVLFKAGQDMVKELEGEDDGCILGVET